MFCTNCGCENDNSSRFCKQCGSPLATLAAEDKTETIETAPAEGMHPAEDLSSDTQIQVNALITHSPQNFTAQGQTTSMSGIGDMLRLGIANPFKGIRNANRPENWLSGLLLFLITDVIIALLITVAAGVVVTYTPGGYMNIFGLTLSVTGHSAGAVFVTAFFLLLFSDVLEVFIIFGIGKAFGSKADLKAWIAASVTSQILFRALTILALLLMMIGPGGMMAGIILISIGALTYLILMFKAFAVSTELDNNRLFYGFLCAYLLFAIAFSIVSSIITAINASMAYSNMYDNYNHFFDNDAF